MHAAGMELSRKKNYLNQLWVSFFDLHLFIVQASTFKMNTSCYIFKIRKLEINSTNFPSFVWSPVQQYFSINVQK